MKKRRLFTPLEARYIETVRNALIDLYLISKGLPLVHHDSPWHQGVGPRNPTIATTHAVHVLYKVQKRRPAIYREARMWFDREYPDNTLIEDWSGFRPPWLAYLRW